MNKEAIAKYQKARRSITRSMARYRRMGYDVPIEKPKKTKLKYVSEASVRRMEKAAQKWREEVYKSEKDFSLKRQRQATAKLDIEDRQMFLQIAREEYGTLDLTPDQIADIVEKIGVGDAGVDALKDLQDLIQKAANVVMSSRFSRASQKQKDYFYHVQELADSAKQRFEDVLDWNDPKKAAVIRKNLQKHWNEISDILEQFLWYDSKQPADWSLLDLIQRILQSNPFGSKSEDEKALSKTARSIKKKKHKQWEKFNATLKEKKEIAKAIQEASKNIDSINL